MSKAVLISIEPKWCEKIEGGEKTIDVRKTKPNVEVPFKCYIYKTKMKLTSNMAIAVSEVQGCGKVIGEFICDRVLTHTNNYVFSKGSCLTREQLWEYGKGKTLYGYHISNLKIYDKPKALNEFYRTIAIEYDLFDGDKRIIKHSITKAPQSWCYVEDLGE